MEEFLVNYCKHSDPACKFTLTCSVVLITLHFILRNAGPLGTAGIDSRDEDVEKSESIEQIGPVWTIDGIFSRPVKNVYTLQL